MKKILVIASMMLFGVVGVQAAGTAAGTDITNDANYSDQVDVVPGAQDQNTTWQFRNEGNMDQNFTFAAMNLTGGTVFTKTDNADTDTTYKYYYDNAGTWTEITGALVVSVDTNITIRVAADIPSGAASDAVMNIELNATAVKASDGSPEEATSGADNKTAMDTVLAEASSTTGDGGTNAAYNGTFTAQSGYEVVTAELDMTKLSCVLEDEVNSRASGNAKRIPGATIRYMFDINNTGAATATDIEIKDELAEAFTDDGSGASKTLLVPAGTRNILKEESQAGACACLTDPGTAVAAGDIDETDNVITVSNVTVNNGTHTCVSFDVEIY